MKKTRQISLTNPERAAEKYINDVTDVFIDAPVLHHPWFAPEGVWTDCVAIDPDNLPVGFVHAGNGRYQYNYNHPVMKRYRPVAYRFPFLQHPNYYDEGWTVSHLCHNSWCYNPGHVNLEPLAVNKARNGCPGGEHCHHQVRCLLPGPYFDS